jgi:hypothetical protein
MANPEMMADFVAGHDNRTPKRDRAVVPRHQVKKHRRPIKTQSVTQAKREAFLAGIKAQRISTDLELLEGVGCSRCPKVFPTFDSAWAGLDLHHEDKRSHGKGYRGGKNFGVDDPRNLELVCKPCHRKLESNPEWTGAS